MRVKLFDICHYRTTISLYMFLQKGFALCMFLLYINENSKNSRGIDGKNKERHSYYFKGRHQVDLDSCEFLELKHHTTYDDLIIFTSNFFMNR